MGNISNIGFHMPVKNLPTSASRSLENHLGDGSRYEVGAYYFPNYHLDPLNEKIYGSGWTEWELLKQARPRFPGHQQPKIPLWGYQDESDPKVFANKIQTAADHGITNFIFDWYWYGGPFLNRALDEGFLKAENCDRLAFSLMWANHDWLDNFPAKLNRKPEFFYSGTVTADTFEVLTDVIVERYFSSPSYWKIDGCPYFSIYQLSSLLKGLGGVENTWNALNRFREKTKSAGFPDLHLNAIILDFQILQGEQGIKDPNELLAALNFSSVTSYVWLHHISGMNFPTHEYRDAADQAEAYWHRARSEFHLPYFPNVTTGWDSSPRTCQSDMFENKGYPFGSTLVNNTPAEFKNALMRVKRFLDHSKSGPKIFTINAWNEWTEGSYLEPDSVNKLEYLMAIKEVFSSPSQG
jgi:hypothetical protein